MYGMLVDRNVGLHCVRNTDEKRKRLLALVLPVSSTFLTRIIINPSEYQGNYSATSNNMKLVYWPLMGGLLHLVQLTHHRPVYQLPYCCIVVGRSTVLMCSLNGWCLFRAILPISTKFWNSIRSFALQRLDTVNSCGSRELKPHQYSATRREVFVLSRFVFLRMFLPLQQYRKRLQQSL